VHVVSTSSLPINFAAQLTAVFPNITVSVPRAGYVGVSKVELASADALVCLLLDRIDAAVLASAPRLRVVANCAVGVDNVDLAAATAAGVAVTNTPDVLTEATAEFAFALMLAAARRLGEGERLVRSGAWGGWALDQLLGIELHGKTLGIVGLGRVGVLVAQRAHAFGMRLVAYDPFVSPDRARQLGVQLADTMNDLVAVSDFVTIHATKTPDTIGLVNAEVLAHAKPGMRLINAGRGGIVDEDALADAIRDGRLGGAAIDTFAQEPTTESPLFELDNVVVTPHLGASTAEAQDKAGETIAEQVILALRGDFVPFAVNVAASEASEVVRPFLPLAERLGRLFSGLAGGAPTTLEVSYEGEIADYDCRVLTLSILKGVLAPAVEEPVTFVNAPQLAEARGIAVRETKQADARNYVNLIEVRGMIGDRAAQTAGTLFGKQQGPRIVGIDEHTVDLPPARYMLVVHNSDTPGMIGRVTTVLGDASVNISDMGVGRSPSGEAALMVLATDSPVPPATVAKVTALPGVQSARAIDLG
jgi:D-3-phosphoglycerate dehydrogenase